ncbi:MAG: hypothetical protein F4X57_09260 [Chloroflexi bacterium]|nr:hypothetical protein [Chloroflexota bacterium]
MRFLKDVAEQFMLMGKLLYLYTLKFLLIIARDLLGGIIAIGFTRSVLILLIAMTILVWYLTLLANG